MIDRSSLEPLLAEIDGGSFKDITPVSGGDMGGTYRLELSHGRFFIKLASIDEKDLLTAEADGLSALAATQTVRVPTVLSEGADASQTWLVIEWLDLESPTRASDRDLGERLAALHRVRQEQFGWHRDNRIGRTSQPNTPTASWLEFFTEHRIGHQLKLAAGISTELDRAGETLLKAMPELLADHDPQPSLLHGDLWGGNRARVADESVVFDPAVYCGDREADLAMTTLFGRFHSDFYAAYEVVWPLPDGAKRRGELYRLYHVLNHLNLFGGGYLQQALQIIRSLVAR